MLPKVSICMPTYNQEKYIAEAVDSVLMQQTDFDYELIIMEDYSTDRTREIVLEYKHKYPEKIVLLLNEENTGAESLIGFVNVFNYCRGQYLAFLDGDDYWTSPHKLQRQVDFLDGHEDFAICFHATELFCQEDDSFQPVINPPSPFRREKMTIEDLLERNFISTSAYMCRRSALGELPPWYLYLYIGDWPLFLLCAQHGYIGYIDEVMSRYRQHPAGIWSSNTNRGKLEGVIEMYQLINSHFSYRYSRIINNQLKKMYFKLMKEFLLENDLVNAKKCYHQCLKRWKYKEGLKNTRLLSRLGFRVCFPGLYKIFKASGSVKDGCN
ncbi:glycosyltransferase [Candidatus Contubernalis alkaliaceticus]|uniref:glycosyltransferase n=1 Tax=Candidatus Contubernalis alkaliaceticus TaxID=338645 RepID=UPI001F4BDDA3|nr:glycosyltransferase [Candidatus Contubernalis alkalaceticus]UNC93587.1 glycosyltransferase [Candidatus Contubernalis alkalaceticus]